MVRASRLWYNDSWPHPALTYSVRNADILPSSLTFPSSLPYLTLPHPPWVQVTRRWRLSPLITTTSHPAITIAPCSRYPAPRRRQARTPAPEAGLLNTSTALHPVPEIPVMSYRQSLMKVHLCISTDLSFRHWWQVRTEGATRYVQTTVKERQMVS